VDGRLLVVKGEVVLTSEVKKRAVDVFGQPNSLLPCQTYLLVATEILPRARRKHMDQRIRNLLDYPSFSKSTPTKSLVYDVDDGVNSGKTFNHHV
jgi:hypothetical protein